MTPDTNSRFMQYQLSADEISVATQLTPETRAWIQNYRASAAEELIANVINPEAGKTLDLMVQAKLQGEIKAYDLILAGVSAPVDHSQQLTE